MSIFDTVKAQQLQARKDKNTNATNILTVLLGELQRRAVQTAPTDDDVFKAAAALKKSLQQSIEKASTEASLQELAIIDGILALQPVVEMASDDEQLQALVQFSADNPDAKMGQYINFLKTTFGARTNGAGAKRIVDIFNASR